jgi:hypothetical protein
MTRGVRRVMRVIGESGSRPDPMSTGAFSLTRVDEVNRAMQNSLKRLRRAVTLAALLLAGAVCATGCGTIAASTTSSVPSGSTASATSTTSTTSPAPKPLVAPKTTAVQDTRYLADVAKADSALATYVQDNGNVALRALLVDGSAFCAFLHRGGGIDNAILSVAVGAKSVEKTTKLPLSVTTFNTVEAVALLDLCPGEQSLVPSSVRSKITALGEELGG